MPPYLVILFIKEKGASDKFVKHTFFLGSFPQRVRIIVVNYFTRIFWIVPLLMRTMLMPFWSVATRVPFTLKIAAT